MTSSILRLVSIVFSCYDQRQPPECSDGFRLSAIPRIGHSPVCLVNLYGLACTYSQHRNRTPFSAMFSWLMAWDYCLLHVLSPFVAYNHCSRIPHAMCRLWYLVRLRQLWWLLPRTHCQCLCTLRNPRPHACAIGSCRK